MIDTLKYTRELESAGLNSKQAEKMVRAQMNMISDSVATKADIYQLRYEMSEKFASLESRFAKIDSRFSDMDSLFAKMDSRFAKIDSRLGGIDSRLDTLETKLILKLGGLMVSCFVLGFGGLGLAAKFLL